MFANSYNRLVHLLLVCVTIALTVLLFVWSAVEEVGTVLPVCVFLCSCVYIALWWLRGTHQLLQRKATFLFYSMFCELALSLIFALCCLVFIIYLLVLQFEAIVVILLLLLVLLAADAWKYKELGLHTY